MTLRPYYEDKSHAPERFPIECDCGDPDGPINHVICSVCGDDWDDCGCVSPVKDKQGER